MKVSPGKLFGWECLQIVRALGGSGISVVALQPASATQIFLVSAPRELGGRGDFAAELETQAADLRGNELADFAQRVDGCLHCVVCNSSITTLIIFQLWERTDGRIVSAAGLPPMHDYEFYPQTVCQLPVDTLPSD